MKSADTRDMFAATAMAALVESQSAIGSLGSADELAEEAYDIAAAMMAERAKQDRTMSAEWRQVEQEIDAQRQMGVTI